MISKSGLKGSSVVVDAFVLQRTTALSGFRGEIGLFIDPILGHFNFAMIGVYETECSYDAKTDEL